MFSKSTVPLREWTHVAVAYDGTSFFGLINGLIEWNATIPFSSLSDQEDHEEEDEEYLSFGVNSKYKSSFIGLMAGITVETNVVDWQQSLIEHNRENTPGRISRSISF